MPDSSTATIPAVGGPPAPPAPPAPARQGPLAGFVRRWPVLAFLAWFFTIGQLLAFAPVILDAHGHDVPRQLFIVLSTLIGLLLPTIVITRVVDGPEGVRRMARSLRRWRVAPLWYAVVLAVPALATVLTVVLAGVPGGATTSSALSAVATGLLLQLVVVLLTTNLWEEVAWAGFVQTRLQRAHGAPAAAVVTGVLFAAQHVSLVAGAPVAEGITLLVVLALLAIPFRFLVGWALNRTGSLLLIGLLHAAGNAVAGGSGFGTGMLPRLYPDNAMATTAHLLVFALLGLVVVTTTRGRLAASTPRRSR
jgi:membrane protease YdiL (CAAX protease family)